MHYHLPPYFPHHRVWFSPERNGSLLAVPRLVPPSPPPPAPLTGVVGRMDGAGDPAAAGLAGPPEGRRRPRGRLPVPRPRPRPRKVIPWPLVPDPTEPSPASGSNLLGREHVCVGRCQSRYRSSLPGFSLSNGIEVRRAGAWSPGPPSFPLRRGPLRPSSPDLKSISPPLPPPKPSSSL